MHYSTPLFNNVPTHTTVDFACGLRAGSTVTCVRRQDQLPLFSYNIYYSTTNTAMGCTDTSVKGTKLIFAECNNYRITLTASRAVPACQ